MVSIPVFQSGGVSSIIYNVEYEPEPCLFLKYKIIIKMQTLQFTYFSHECMEATAMQSWGIQKGCVYD